MTVISRLKTYWSRYGWLFIVVAATLFTRWVYLWQTAQQPGFEFPMVDEKLHWEWAQQILHESFWGEGAWFRGPLYPYFLALLAGITRSSIFWTKFLQVLLTAGTAVFIWRMARHLFGRAAAVAAGLGYAVYGTFLFYDTMFMIEVLFLFLLSWGMCRLVLQRESSRWTTWLLTGIVFGLASISRPNVLLAIPFLALWLALVSDGARFSWCRWRRPIAMGLGVVLMVLPVTARNLAVTGEFIPISSQGGINFYLGNNEKADGLTMLMPEVALDESVSWRQFFKVTQAAAEKEAGHSLSEGELSSFWTGKALGFIASHPGKFIQLTWKKLVFLTSGFENSDNGDIYYQRQRSTLYSWLVWHFGLYCPFGLLLPLAVMGGWVLRNQGRALAPLYVFMAAYVPSIVLFLVTARHRLPLVPFLLIIAAGGAVWLVQRWSALKRSSKAKLGLGLMAVLLLCNKTWYGEEKVSGVFQTHFENGMLCEKAGDLEGAEREYLAADAVFPYSATLINNLAYAQYRLGKQVDAKQNYERAIALDPSFVQTYNNLGLLIRDMNLPDSAIRLFRTAISKSDPTRIEPEQIAQMQINVASAWEKAGQLDSAAEAYAQAMKIAPKMIKAFTSAAAYYARYEGYRRADSLYREAANLKGSLEPADFFNWGLALLQGGRFAHSRAMMQRALYMDPHLYEAKYCMALAYFQEGSPRDSVRLYLRQCLEAKPDYQPALQLKAVLDSLGG